MPLVFGWYPPDMSSPIISSPFSTQEFSQLPLYSSARREFMFARTAPMAILDDEEITARDKSPSNLSESAEFFDCESERKEPEIPLSPKVQVVGKTVLQGFKDERLARPGQSSSSSSKVLMPEDAKLSKDKPKVRKSPSAGDIKVTKAPLLSSSSFSRVFSPFSSSPVKKVVVVSPPSSSSSTSPNASPQSRTSK